MIALTLLVAALVTPTYTSHNDVAGNTETMTNISAWAAGVQNLSDSVNAWSAYWDGDDVRVTVTNYYGSLADPSLYLEQKITEGGSNYFKTVWREMTRWDKLATWTNSISKAVDEKADRAWGFYDSHTGNYAPDGYTQISSSNVILAAGMSYQKRVTTSAEVWVLTANEPYAPTGVPDNGGFQIRDSDGNIQFEIIKGDKVTVAAQANGVTVDGSTLIVTYNITGPQPTAEVCFDLSAADWKSQDDSDCPATVSWTGESGEWIATITPRTATTKCFVKATYEKGGDTYINNRCAVGMSKIVLGGKTYKLGTATIDSKTVLTLTEE